VTLQTRGCCFYRLAKNVKHQVDHPACTEEELQHPDTPAFRSKLRRKANAEARKLGMSF